MTTRRGFLLGIGAVLAAPAIVRASSLMPIKSYLYEADAPFVIIDYELVEMYGVSDDSVIISYSRAVERKIAKAFDISVGVLRNPAKDHSLGGRYGVFPRSFLPLT